MGFGGPGFKHFHCVGCGKMVRGVPETPAQPLCDACSGGAESGAEDSEIERLKRERDQARAEVGMLKMEFVPMDTISKARLRELLPDRDVPLNLRNYPRAHLNAALEFMNKRLNILRRELGLDDEGTWDHAVTLDDDDRELGLDSTGG